MTRDLRYWATHYRGQLDIPGTAPDVAGLLRQRANETLRPARPQAPCDVGLFGDSPAQIDLIDFINSTARI